MSKPHAYESVNSVAIEIISGCSSLHMCPNPVENPQGEYISDTDANVRHSLEHFHAAVDMLRSVSTAFNRLIRAAECLYMNDHDTDQYFELADMKDTEKAEKLAEFIVRRAHKERGKL